MRSQTSPKLCEQGSKNCSSALVESSWAHPSKVDNTHRSQGVPDFYPRFFRLGTVNILSNLMVPLAGLVDVAFLGHLEDIRYLAGVAISTVLFDYLYRISKFLRMGTTGPTAQAVGCSDQDTILLTLLRHGCIALVLGLCFLFLQVPLREVGFALLNAAPDVKAAGIDYYNARIWGAPAVLLNFVLLGWLVGREQSGKVLALSIIGNAANIFLDYWLVFRWQWASAGVGVATAASQYLMLFVGLIIIAQENWFPKVPSVFARIFDPDALMQTFKFNTDIWIRSCINVSIYALFIGLSASLGIQILAMNTLLLQVVVLTTYLIDGLAFATESFAGSFRGAGSEQMLKPLLKLSVALSLTIGLSVALVFSLFPAALFGVLTTHREVIGQMDVYVLWLLPVLGFGSLAFMFNGYFLGLTEGTVVRNSMITSAILGFAPIACVAWNIHNSQLLWLAMSVFMVIRVITQATQIPKSILHKSEDNWLTARIRYN